MCVSHGVLVKPDIFLRSTELNRTFLAIPKCALRIVKGGVQIGVLYYKAACTGFPQPNEGTLIHRLNG